ncbi:MAG: glutathione S-transferase family protein [Pseudomonadota bacterium]
MYILYHNPYSQHARRVVALLEEAELPYELCNVAMEKDEHLSPAYLEINPNHQIPTLIDGEFKIHESNAILRYLCTKHRIEEWYPSDPAARAKVDQWLDWGQCRLSPAVVDIVLNKVFAGERGDPAAIRRGEQRMAELGPILAEGLNGNDYLAGERPSIADLAIGSSISQLGFADAMPRQATIAAWHQRVSGLPGFQKSMPTS